MVCTFGASESKHSAYNSIRLGRGVFHRSASFMLQNTTYHFLTRFVTRIPKLVAKIINFFSDASQVCDECA